jgi:hypothetical protein
MESDNSPCRCNPEASVTVTLPKADYDRLVRDAADQKERLKERASAIVEILYRHLDNVPSANAGGFVYHHREELIRKIMEL